MEYLRDDAIHKATTKLTALADTITIETLDIKGMVGPKKSGKDHKKLQPLTSQCRFGLRYTDRLSTSQVGTTPHPSKPQDTIQA